MSQFCTSCNGLNRVLSPSLGQRKQKHVIRHLPNPLSCDGCEFFTSLMNQREGAGFPIYIWSIAQCTNNSLLLETQLGNKDDEPNNLFTVSPWTEGDKNQWASPAYSLIRSWIDQCSNSHSNSCQRTPDVTIPDFTLLDVHTRQLVTRPFSPSPSHSLTPYIALSYVWGKNDAFQPVGAAPTNTSFPPLIEDVMTVAKELGYDFIWVDRYCLPYMNHAAKCAQLANMGQIYQHADLTIVASRGLNPAHGLNGLSEQRTAPQRVSNWVLHPAHNALRREVVESEWNSRGWTYQEAILSRRLLIFTSTQCYFQCNAGYCLEHCPTNPGAKLNIEPIFDLMGANPKLEEPLDYSLLETYIDEFSVRNLTFDTDRFNAIKGVLDNFEGRAKSLRIFQGIPLATGIGLPNDMTVLTLGLSWYPRTMQPTKRMAHFPSWTWLGWRLENNSRTLVREETGFHLNSTSFTSLSVAETWPLKEPQKKNPPVYHCSLVDISLATDSTGKRPWDISMVDDFKAASLDAKNTALHMSGWIARIEVDLRSHQWMEGDICFTRRSHIDTDETGDTQTVTGILIHSMLKTISRAKTSLSSLGVDLGPYFGALEKHYRSDKEYTLATIGIMAVRELNSGLTPCKYMRCGWIEASYIVEALSSPFVPKAGPELGPSLVKALKDAPCLKDLARGEAIVE